MHYYRVIFNGGNILALCWIIGVICLFLKKEPERKVFRLPPIHRLYWFAEDFFKKYPVDNPVPKRDYTEISFNGNESNDKIKLAFSQVCIKEIVSDNDTLRGLRFQFSDSSTFGTFFSLLTIIRENGARYYLPMDDVLWFHERSRYNEEEAH